MWAATALTLVIKNERIMIVESMTHEEVYEELAREREAVARWWEHQLDAVRRKVLRATKFPVYIWRDYTSPRKNRYLFFSRSYDKRMRNVLTGIAVMRYTSEGLTVYTTWAYDARRINPMVLLPHVWKRYAERMGVQKHGVELVNHFFERNRVGKDSHNQKAVGRSVRSLDKEHLSCCLPEGVLLGQTTGDMFIAHTFITYDMCTGLQQEEFEEKKMRIPTDKELLHL